MKASLQWTCSVNEREKLIRTLTENLPLLRAKLNISQEQIARIIGISRQTYSSVENQRREMSWQIYLALILFLKLIQRHMGCCTIWSVFRKC